MLVNSGKAWVRNCRTGGNLESATEMLKLQVPAFVPVLAGFRPASLKSCPHLSYQNPSHT